MWHFTYKYFKKGLVTATYQSFLFNKYNKKKEGKKIMEGIVKSFKLRNVKTKDNKEFKTLDYVCDVVVNEEKGEIKTLKGSMSAEYARKYFAFCGVKTADLVNKKVNVVISKRKYENSNGEERTVNFIKYLNVLDEEGNPIIISKEENNIDF